MLWFANGSGLETVVLLRSHTKTNGLCTSAGARRAKWVEPPPALRITARIGPQPHPASSYLQAFRSKALCVPVCKHSITSTFISTIINSTEKCITLAMLRKNLNTLMIFKATEMFFSRLFFPSKHVTSSAKKTFFVEIKWRYNNMLQESLNFPFHTTSTFLDAIIHNE